MDALSYVQEYDYRVFQVKGDGPVIIFPKTYQCLDSLHFKMYFLHSTVHLPCIDYQPIPMGMTGVFGKEPSIFFKS
jgi:hypothetical protein